jgi:hypothetical protein
MQHTSTQKDSSDEWTFVSSKKKAKKHTKEKHLAKAKRQLHLLLDDDHDLNNQQRICDPTENDVAKLIENIEGCMKTLELFHTNRHQNKNNDMSSNFVQELLNTIMEAADLNYLRSKGSFKEVSCTQQKLREIICYGIGNFDKVSASTLQSTKFSSPMIQLSCALLLRKKLEMQSPILEIEQSSSSAKEHQILIPMRYYEPLIKPIERKVLQHFQVELLENEQGKRPIRSSQNHNEHQHADPLGISLFFMPHCPMRLYSNLLWANWEPSKLSRIVIFGNSFKAYDERILSSDQRNDSSNAIFPILDYVQEYSIGDIGDNRKTMSHLDVVGCSVSLAFNDCVVISFDVAKDDVCWPNRPTEYLVQHDCLESEIL